MPRPQLPGQLDPSTSTFVFITGKKGSGKSLLAKRLWDTYPYDRLCINPTKDFDPGPDAERITDPLPPRWPMQPEGKRVSLNYEPDPGDPAYEDNLDRAVGLAFYHPDKRCMLLVDEVAELTRANRTGPHTRRALHQGRHRGLTMVMCGPRPIDVNPLCLNQADYVYVFKLQNPDDRERVAKNIGWDPKDFDAAMFDLKRYEYLRYDAGADDEEDELVHFPKLPL